MKNIYLHITMLWCMCYLLSYYLFNTEDRGHW